MIGYLFISNFISFVLKFFGEDRGVIFLSFSFGIPISFLTFSFLSVKTFKLYDYQLTFLRKEAVLEYVYLFYFIFIILFFLCLLKYLSNRLGRLCERSEQGRVPGQYKKETNQGRSERSPAKRSERSPYEMLIS